MNTIHQTIKVRFDYPVHFTTQVFDRDNPLLADAVRQAGMEQDERSVFIIDANLAQRHPKLSASIVEYCGVHQVLGGATATTLILPGGEEVKNDPRHLQTAYQAIEKAGLSRHSFVIGLGGGALLDLAGYAAATAHRGIRHIRIPTTVLAQNDSGVGVKNSVNAFGKKNFFGTFAPPNAVINDFSFLTTLEQRDWLAGTSEAVKVGLIKEGDFFRFVHDNAAKFVARDMPAMQRLIYRCAQLHAQHISAGGDPFESGTSRPLDFGHWAAHKLEQMTNFELRHGEAVAIGIALDCTYSAIVGLLQNDQAEVIRQCLRDLHLPRYIEAMRNTDKLMDGLEEFREHLGGELTIMMLRRIGEGCEIHQIDRNAMREAIRRLESESTSVAAA